MLTRVGCTCSNPGNLYRFFHGLKASFFATIFEWQARSTNYFFGIDVPVKLSGELTVKIEVCQREGSRIVLACPTMYVFFSRGV